MVGVGGSGMSGLAAMLLKRGAQVSGVDSGLTPAIARLKERGGVISQNQDASGLPPNADLLVASAAVPASHPQLLEAQRRGVEILKYAQMLGALMQRTQGIAISGTHGKSTTTAWLAYTLRRAGLSPSFVVGAECDQLGGGSDVGDGPHFVVEACEYDRSFLNLRPRMTAILNIEEDHLDYYRDLDEITRAFAAFAGLTPDDGYVLLNADDPRCMAFCAHLRAPHETFGVQKEANWRAVAPRLAEGRYEFTLTHDGHSLGAVRLGLAGPQNVSNALAVAALADRAGVAPETIRASLAEFHGARRRLEVRATVAGVTVADDYAHHPTELRVTLQAARERFSPRRIWCVFQPHQHSRTRFLLNDFAQSFGVADHIIVPRIYFVRDSEREREAVQATDLVEAVRARGGDAVYISELGAIVDYLAERVESGDLVLTMGAGDIWKVADELVQRLRARLPG